MREIKFRAWNPNANKFDSYAGVTNMSLGEAGALWAKNIPMEFQQFTGLKDKNGKEIYEGDIVAWHYNDEVFHRDVEWIEAEAMFLPNAMIEDPKVEVVGNIYENPELLNSKEASTKGGEKSDE